MRIKLRYMVVILIVLFCVNCPVFASENRLQIDVPYEYPVTPGMSNWEELDTHEKKVAACQIPTDILKIMTTDALIQSIIDYPLAVDMYAYDSVDEGYEVLRNQFNAIRELESRMKEYDLSKEICPNAYSMSLEKDFHDFFKEDLFDILSGEEGIQENFALPSEIMPLATNRYVLTPKGSHVLTKAGQTWSDTDTTEAKCEAINNEFMNTYTSARKIEGITPVYNCHSYAWNMTDSRKLVWMPDPSKYISDGSYVIAGTNEIGYKVLYGNKEHSGVIQTLSNGNRIGTVRSKWGMCSLFDHLPTDCPYSSSMKVYRLAN